MPLGRLTLFTPLIVFLSLTSVRAGAPAPEARPEEGGIYLNPPVPSTWRLLPEFERMDGVLLRWPSDHRDAFCARVVSSLQAEGNVYLLVADAGQKEEVEEILKGQGIGSERLNFLIQTGNSVWIRDSGPLFVQNRTDGGVEVLDARYDRPWRPDDDLLPSALADLWDVPTKTLELTLPGGNLLTDGQGTGFASSLIYDENPQLSAARIAELMKTRCGISRFCVLTKLRWEYTGHLDVWMKLLDAETILVGGFPQSCPDYPVVEANVAFLKTLKTPYGNSYRIIRIPQPAPQGWVHPSYTNSLIFNNLVLVPTYGLPTDEEALRIYRQAMPEHEVVGIDCREIIQKGGALHCLAMGVKMGKGNVYYSRRNDSHLEDRSQASY